MALQMEIVSEELIKPSSPTPQNLKHHKLSHLDQVLLTCHIPIILFYPNQSTNSKFLDNTQKSHHLKQSLSQVLTQFYPLAGRINKNSSIDCNDYGVPFLESKVQSQLSDAIQNIPVKEFSQFLPFQPYPSGDNDDQEGVKKEIPLAVKINFFDCGGIAIGVCLSHKIADALSLSTFLKAWAGKASGEIDIVVPNFDLGAHHFPAMDNIPAPEFVPDKNIVMERFVFGKEKIQALKEQASSASEKPSRAQVVIALIWKHFIDVTKAKTGSTNKFVAAQAVNLRSRMSPPFPESAMGNIATLAFTVADEGRDISDLVGPLKDSIGKIDEEHVKELQKGVTYLDYEAEPQELFSFSSWCRLGFYELDFGWGKPISACTTTVPMKNLVYLMDTRNGDGIEAWISMEVDEMAMLPSDFLSLVDSDFSK